MSERAFEMVRGIFNEKVPFNKVLGVVIESLSFDGVTLRFDNRPELVGNFVHQSLHGGVVSATLDLTGGVVAYVSVLEAMEGKTSSEKAERLANVGTIDLRVDYLRPGLGESFVASGNVLRAGRKVTVARMDLHNDAGDHIAAGTGTYSVG